MNSSSFKDILKHFKYSFERLMDLVKNKMMGVQNV